MASNDAAHVAEWMQQGLLVRVTDNHASEWSEQSRQFRAVVVAPWVLVHVLDPPCIVND